jgi:hypothetical protein
MSHTEFTEITEDKNSIELKAHSGRHLSQRFHSSFIVSRRASWPREPGRHVNEGGKK